MIEDADTLRRFAVRLLIICSLIELGGWACLVLYGSGAYRGPATSLLLVPGILMAGGGLFGVTWTAIQLSKLPKS
jgi:hypothetical protein